MLEQATLGRSLNSIRNSYLTANARALPPPSPAAGSAIILAEGTLIALASAKEHRTASDPLGLSSQSWWQLSCSLGRSGGASINTSQTLLTEAFLSVASCSARPQVLQLNISMPSVCPRLIYLFFLQTEATAIIGSVVSQSETKEKYVHKKCCYAGEMQCLWSQWTSAAPSPLTSHMES